MSRAIIEFAVRAPDRQHSDEISEIRVVPGLGVKETGRPRIPDRPGEQRFMREQELSIWGPRFESAAEDAESHGLPLCMVGWDEQVRGFSFLKRNGGPAARP